MSYQKCLLQIVWSVFFLISPFITKVHATSPWPGELWTEAEILTHLDPEFADNLSGAHWNPNTRTLWVCLNGPGKFWAIVEDGNGSFEVDYQGANRAEWYPNGDLEGITQANLNEPSVYVIAEGVDRIRKYDVSRYGIVALLREWNISSDVPTSGGSGSEGITFVPDYWLALSGFVDENGETYTSQNGMGGLFFIAHQNGGGVYVFDLDPDSGVYDFVGRYLTSRGESSGLEFDRSSGVLYVWHNTGSNYLELTDLSSFVRADGQRQFNTLVEYNGPKGGNLEGIAVTPITSQDHWILIVDDDNQNGAALMWFDEFFPDIELPTMTTEVRVSSSTDDAEEAANGSVNLASTDLELVQEASTQTIGIRFASLGVPAHATITRAYIQFTVDEATANGTALTIYGENSSNPSAYSSTLRGITSRARTAGSVPWSPEPWAILGESLERQRTSDLTAIVQEIVNRNDWAAGNPLAFVITGAGKRVAKSYNGMPSVAPLLHVEYTEGEFVEPEPAVMTLDVGISSANDDAEERADGSMYLTSTDLELVEDGANQTVGLRFGRVDLPQGAFVTGAYLQFTVDETSLGYTSLDIRGELSDAPQAFTNNQRNISLRNRTSTSVNWVPEVWNVLGQAAESQRSTDIGAIVQEITNQGAWTSGNPMVFIITGSGKRVAKSYNGSANLAPQLHIEYQLISGD